MCFVDVGYKINVLVDFFLCVCIVSSSYITKLRKLRAGEELKNFDFNLTLVILYSNPPQNDYYIQKKIPFHISVHILYIHAHRTKPWNSTYLGIFITCSGDEENKNMVKRSIIFFENVCLKRKLRIFLSFFLGKKTSDILILCFHIRRALLNIMKFLNIVTFILGKAEHSYASIMFHILYKLLWLDMPLLRWHQRT